MTVTDGVFELQRAREFAAPVFNSINAIAYRRNNFAIIYYYVNVTPSSDRALA